MTTCIKKLFLKKGLCVFLFFFMDNMLWRQKNITFGARSDGCVDTKRVENDNFLFQFFQLL